MNDVKGWKLVPVEPTTEQRLAVCMHPDLASALYRSMVKAAPTLPNFIACHVDESCGQGGGEVEVLGYVLTMNGNVHFETDDNIVISNVPGDEITEQHKWLPVVDRAHVTRLQADLQTAYADKETMRRKNNELHEEIEKWSGTALQNGMECDHLQSELDAERREHAETERISQQEELRANDYATQLVAVQSELTKALAHSNQLPAKSLQGLKQKDEFTWHTGCGQAWSFTEDGPKENGVKFCHSCGNKLEMVPAAKDEGDE